MQGFVYRWRNLLNQWSYIGSTAHIRKRHNLHLFLLRANRHHSRHFQAAWNKYGEAAFAFEVVASVQYELESQLRDIENDYLRRYAGSLYNAAPTAHSVQNIKRSEETRAKISAALTGQKRSAETRARIAEAQRNRPASTRNLGPLIASRRGVRLSPEHRAKIAAANRRRTVSAESKLRMRMAHLRARAEDPSRWANCGGEPGGQHSEATRLKISEALRGKLKNPDAILKQAAAQSRRPSGALLLSPDGCICQVLNVSAFARAHRLSQGSLSAVILGKRRIHKGWTLVGGCEPSTYGRVAAE